MAGLTDRYDRKKGGQQTLQMFAVGSRVSPVQIRLDWTRKVRVGKGRYRVSCFTVALQSGSLQLYTDSGGRVLLVDIPFRYAYWTRQGYASLRPTPTTDPNLSKPTHRVRVERNVKIPMRDGVNLSTLIFRPARPGKYPSGSRGRAGPRARWA
jgi:hypothetical protein